MKAINRFIRYCDFKGLKPSRFEKDFGVSNGYFSVQLKRNGSLGEDTLKIIIDNCQDINPEWLIVGKGEMLKKESDKNDNSSETIDLVTEVFRLSAENDQLKETNDLLRFKINVLEERNPAEQYKDREQDAYRNVAEPQPELIKKKSKKDKS